jgi:hypothetical protein
VSTGVSGVETFNDVQFEKAVRYQTMQVLSMISDFSRATLNVLLGRPSGSLFGTPSQTKQYIISNGEYGRKDQLRLVNSYMKFVLNKQNIEIPDAVAPFLEEMRKNMDSMMEILYQGECYPSAEMNEKPIPWTPLMCACVLNDLKSIRKLKQWGADPNYQNRHGTTALMLAAQLHNVDAVAELLVAGADTSILDSEGFSAMAYAASLPMPHELQRSAIHVICDGEQGSGSKAYRADEVLKLAVTCTPAQVKEKIRENKSVVAREVVTKFKPQLKLLEKQGLSVVDTMEGLEGALRRAQQDDAAMRNIAREIEALKERNIGTRSSVSIDSLLRFDKAESNHDGSVGTISFASNDVSEGTELPDLSDLLIEAKETSEVVVDPDVAIRCPICTLKIPCNHFYNKAAHDDYIEKRKSGKKNYSDGSALGYEQNIKKREAQIHQNRITNNVINGESMKVLREAELDDRKTNRNDRYLQYLKEEEAAGGKKGTPPAVAVLPAIEDVIPLNPYAQGAVLFSAGTGPATDIEPASPLPSVPIADTDTPVNNSDSASTGSMVSNITEPSLGKVLPQKVEATSFAGTSTTMSGEEDGDDVRENDSEMDVFVKKQYEKEESPQDSLDKNAQSSQPLTSVADKTADESKIKVSDDEKASPATVQQDAPKTEGAAKKTSDNTSSTDVTAKEQSGNNVDEDTGVHEYYQLTAPLPSLSDSPARSVLMQTYKSSRRRVLAERSAVKKFHKNRRVVKFRINDEVLDGGIGAEGVRAGDVSVSSYEESLNEGYTSRVDLVLEDEDEDHQSSLSSLTAPNTSEDDEKEKEKEKKAAKEAVHQMLVGSKNEEDKDASLQLFGVNPVAPHRRTVSMFTQRYKDAVLLDTKNTAPRPAEQVTTAAVASKEQPPSTGDSAAQQKNPQNLKFLANKFDQRLYFSGWIFSGLFSLDVAKKPIDTICIDPENWRNCLTQLNESFKKQWMPNLLRMECLVDMETWKVSTKQCSTCMLGFVRYRVGAAVSDDDKLIKDVCLACFSRKKLYDSVVKSIPRSARKMFLFEWPFHVKDDGVEKFSDDDRKAMIMRFLRGYSGAAAIAKVDDGFDPSRIMESKIVADTLQMSEVVEEAPPDAALLQKEVIANYYKTSKKRDQAKHFMTMVNTGEIAPIVIEEENKANLFEKKKRVYAGGRTILAAQEAQVKSISLTEHYSSRERAKIQPSELPLLHVLLSNHNYEEVERVCRVCVALEEYGGEAGVLYVATLAVLQCEMYKMMGLWVLALALLIDATDLLVSRLGFDDKICVSAFCNIDLIFRRLDMQAAGKLYISSLVAKIKKHSFSDNLRKSENIDAILARYR